ncbi:hypothetical protein V1387_00740 [Allomuricauda taeanensis]|uniref:hypothetical protein n=1 Tax=Flagellimonas taeanensis TaxID=1005926 RepID=UPI002E7C2D5E|nr:hypothetical protein [Allomuricauda taeanensis]MEE1961189.1 hypothetical protein [Allomuricauda taeanensis]
MKSYDNYKNATSEDIKNLIEEIGLNRNRNRCYVKKQIVYEVNNFDSLYFDLDNKIHQAVKSLIERDNKSEFTIL